MRLASEANGMTLAADQELPEPQSRQIAAMVREELARRRISRQALADKAKLSLSTLEKALSGRRPFTLATTVRLEEALGLPLRNHDGRTSAIDAACVAGLASGDLGSYARPAVSWIEGGYLTLRPSFGAPDSIFAYRTEIAWDDACSNLIFRESDRVDTDYTQVGLVSMPTQSGHIYLVTNQQGQYRLIIVTRPTIAGEMFGILTTLRAGRGSQLTPVAAPIVMVPVPRFPDAQYGRIAEGHPCFARYRAYLRRTLDDNFAVLLSGD